MNQPLGAAARTPFAKLRETEMPDFNDLWIWLTALKSSMPFVAAVTILFAGLLASGVDWIEHYLTADQHERGPDVHPAVLQQHGRVAAMPRPLKSKLEA
jgi:hypothetical protein